MIKRFETQEELHRYLLRDDHPKVRNIGEYGELGSTIVGYKDGQIWRFDTDRSVPNISMDPNCWVPYESLEWYEKPEAKGILCFFWDSSHGKKRIAPFDYYRGPQTFRFVDDRGTAWMHAEPIPSEELYELHRKAVIFELSQGAA